MSTHTITIEISATGEIKSTVHGVAGPDCSKISQWLDEIGDVTKDEKTLDFGKQPDQTLKITRR